jgi:hypothetical protein
MPFPRVFERYHDALQRYFTGRCPSLLCASLPAGRCTSREAWVKSRPITRPALPDLPFYILGRIDHLLEFEDRTVGIADYKTTEIAYVRRAAYARQLHAYAWAIEQAAPGELSVERVSRLGLFCLEPVGMTGYAPGRSATVELRPMWLEVPRDDDAFGRALDRVLALVASDNLPDPGPACATCTYLRKRDACSF